MKYFFGILVLLHGTIHGIGFVKGFSLAEINELKIPVSESEGVLWLTTTLLFFVYLATYLSKYRFSWIFGILAVAISQILIIISWPEAGFGTVPNIIILFVSLISFGRYKFRKRILAEAKSILYQGVMPEERMISESDIMGLPVPVKKWLLRSGAVGKPYIHSGRVLQKAEMKMKPGQKKWMKASAMQYSALDIPAFIWTVKVKMNSIMCFRGRDKFMEGRGEMLIKFLSLFNVVNEKGEKLTEGTLQRYLGEMVWFPSLALSPHISWEQINDNAAKAVMNYKGSSGSGTFYFNPDGDFFKFSAMRFMGNGADAGKHEWVLSVNDYHTFEGIRVPSKMTATWKLEAGDWTWLKLEIEDIKYNIQSPDLPF